MRYILGILAFAYTLSAQPTVSAVSIKNSSWSSAEVEFSSTSYTNYRIRYIESADGSCSGGSGGALQKHGTQQFMNYGQRAYLTGLKPSTAYRVCPETTSNGSLWSSGNQVEFTTSARGSATPTAPTEMSRTFPAQGGATLMVASNCSDLQTKINAAVGGDTVVIPAGTVCTGEYTTPTAPDAHNFADTDVTPATARLAWASHGLSEMDEIHFGVATLGVDCLPGTGIHPRGVNIQIHCGVSGGWNLNKRLYAHVVDSNTIQVVDSNGDPVYPGWVTFASADISVGGDTITLTPNYLTPNGYATGGGSSIAANTEFYFVPLSGATLPTGISSSTKYYLLGGGCGSGTATCALQISTSSGGSAFNFSDTGSGTFLIATRGSATNSWVAPAPAHGDDWILITTDGNLPPDGTRITSAWDSQLVHFRRPADDRTSVSFTPGILAHNWRLRGVIFDADTDADTDYMTMMEPRGFKIGPSTNQGHRFIVFDRCRVQGATGTHRTGESVNNGMSMELNGGYIAFIDSDLRDLDYGKAWRGNSSTGPASGMDGTRVSNTVARLSAGEARLINGTTVTLGANLDLTVSNGGGVTGVGRVGIDLAGHIQYLLPAGVTATCDTGVFANCDVANDAGTSPAFPTSNSRRTWLGLYTITFTAGNIASVTEEESVPGFAVSGVSEGAQSIIAGKGPGPFLLYNNYVGGSGLTVHFDEGGGQMSDRGDYVIRGNTFQVSARSLFDQGMDWDGLYYGNRQPLEWKGGNRILVTGNTFQNCFAQIHSQTFCIVITSYYYSVTDVDITSNNFWNVNGGVWAMTSDRLYPTSRLLRRVRISNNLLRINAWANYTAGLTFPRGFVFQTNAAEDVTLENNTVFNHRGNISSFIRHNLGPVGGMVIRDNAAFYNGEAAFITSEDVSTECTGLSNKAFAACEFIQGYPDASGTDSNFSWEHSVIVPSWTNTETQTGQVTTSTVTTAFTGLVSDCGVSCVPDQASVAAAISYVNWTCGDKDTCNDSLDDDFTLAAMSPYKGQGTGGADIGIAFPTLQQRTARGVSAEVTATAGTTATITITNPQGDECPVDYNTTSGVGVATYTRATPTSGVLNLTSLTPQTTYYARVNCTNTSVALSFTTTGTIKRLSGAFSLTGSRVLQ